MSNKPDTPRTDDSPAGTKQEHADIPTGRRFTGNTDILTTERELVTNGVELPNRAISVEYHASSRTYTNDEIQQIIESELDKDAPNRQLIGYLNKVKAQL